METKDSQNHFFELYKFYVELTDRISQRRGQTNTFFLSIISTLIGLVGFVFPFIDEPMYKSSSTYIISILGILLCLIWYLNINSYKQLNKLKFTVIHEIEKNLIFPCFTREWHLLREEKIKYHRLTTIEKFIPLLFMIPFIVFFIFKII